jgi:hypothetical protein
LPRRHLGRGTTRGLAIIAALKGGSIPSAVFILVVVAVAGAWAQLRAQASHVEMVRRHLLGKKPVTLAKAWSAGSGHVLRLLGTELLASLALGGAMLACWLPFLLMVRSNPTGAMIAGLAGAVVTLYLAVAFAMRLVALVPVVLLERKGGTAALGRAWELASGQLLTIFGSSLVCGLVLAPLGYATGWLEQYGAVAVPLGILISGATTVFGHSLIANLYFGLRAGQGTRRR